jgi:hypothetical protein
MNPKPRRWFQFSLRTMFIVVTLASLVCGWVAYSLHWIGQRREFLQRPGVYCWQWPAEAESAAPGLLWIFGEQAYRAGDCPVASLDEARRLFPETKWTGWESKRTIHLGYF